MTTINKLIRQAQSQIKPFLSTSQYKTLEDLIKGEEGVFFTCKLNELTDIIDTMPKTYETDGMGDSAIVHLHYFKGGSDWYITEKDMDGGIYEAFGYACLNGDICNAELGYISIRELVANGVEIDFYWELVTLGDVKMKKAA